jgi:hypothetical protein
MLFLTIAWTPLNRPASQPADLDIWERVSQFGWHIQMAQLFDRSVKAAPFKVPPVNN